MKKLGIYTGLLMASLILGTSVANAESASNSISGKAESGDLKVSTKNVDLGRLVIGEDIQKKNTQDLVSVSNNTGNPNGVELLVRSNNYNTHKDNIKLSLDFNGKENLITNSNKELEVFETKVDNQNRDGSFSGEWGNFAKSGAYSNDLVWTVIPKTNNYKDNMLGLIRNAQTSGIQFDYTFKHSFSGSTVSPSEISGFSSIVSSFQGNRFMNTSVQDNVITATRSLSFDSVKSSYKFLKETGSYVTTSPNKNKEMLLYFDRHLWDLTVNTDIEYPIRYTNDDKVILTVKSLVSEASHLKVTPQDYWSGNISDKDKALLGSTTTSMNFNYGSLSGYVPIQAKNGEVYYLKINYEAKP